jgi:glutamyl-Q tRNA(Asp) synthetase
MRAESLTQVTTQAKPLAWRLRVPTDTTVRWDDRRLGRSSQTVNEAVGDFILRRADGLWSYQLAVVCDDARQGISHVVRGEDLSDNTPRQILLQKLLQLPSPVYLHTTLVVDEGGEKLSKQQGAQPVNTAYPLAVLNQAAKYLGLPEQTTSPGEALQLWVRAWRARWTGLYNPGQDDSA